MPSTDYEKSDIQYPGQFKCSEIALISLSGKIAGIKSAVLEMNIYESLFNNFLTGDLTFRDDFNLLDSLPIQGSEYLDFKIRTPIRSAYRDPTTSNEDEKFLIFGFVVSLIDWSIKAFKALLNSRMIARFIRIIH